MKTEIRNLAGGVALALVAGLPAVYLTRSWRPGRAGAVVLVVATLALWLGLWLTDALGARVALRRARRAAAARPPDPPAYLHLVEDPAEDFWREVQSWSDA